MPKHEKKSKHLKLKASKTLNIHADENFSSSVNIGLSNVSKWNQLKKELYLKTDEAFVAHLLKTLENSLSENTIGTKTASPGKPSDVKKASKNAEPLEKISCSSVIEPPSSSSNGKNHQMQSILENKIDNSLNNGTNQSHKGKVKKGAALLPQNQNNFSLAKDQAEETTTLSLSEVHDSGVEQTELTVLEADITPISCKSVTQDEISERVPSPPPISSSAPESATDPSVSTVSKVADPEDMPVAKSKILTKKKTPLDKGRLRKRKFPSNKTSLQCESSAEKRTCRSKTSITRSNGGNSPVKPCPSHNLPHSGSISSLFHPVRRIKDSISYEDWVKGDVFVHSNSVCDSGEELNFSKCSLPECLELKSIESSHDYSVIARLQIPQFTEFGPLIGEKIKMQDIPDDCNMRSIWEVQKKEGSLFYLSTENLNLSNWLAYIRPAPSSETCNVTIVTRDSQLYFVTMTTITMGSELLYWTDNIAKIWDDKKVNKKNCGGCNLKFDHNFYYRLHCQIFHDPNCSLTVRKYHCKVCGAAVLGKQNIVKHAAELHKGKGAYQCPFCKKFFLRLNYLDMHKTYGCSANPQRSRPLCDFCGRKFCQPQKLKVHIKRMHGDISSILAEFQCMSCLRVLGSRAALQRHNKEVHHKSERESFTCHQCGKGFQNKSNLKIHMLTHSGIKPFRCSVGECSSAFTTKQCLQLHYKKFHGLSEDNMPPIRRTVEYTFNAYAGGNMSDSQVDSPQSCENSDNQYQVPTSPVSQVAEPQSTIFTPTVENTSHENSSDSFNQNNDDIIYNTNNYDEFSDCINNSSVIMRGSRKWVSEETIHETKDRHLALPITADSEGEPEVETKLLYPYGRTDSSNASLLVEAAIDAVEKVINVGHPPLNFTISHDSAEIPSGIDQEEARRVINSPSPIPVPQFTLASHPESQSNSLDISISSTYQGEISPPHYGAPYSLHLSPVDVVNVAEQNEPYLRKTDDVSGDESENPVQNLSLSSKDRLHIDILAYKPYSDSIEEKSNLLKPYDNRDRLQFLKHYSPLDDRNLKYDGLDDRLINVPEDRLNLFKQYELLDERSPTLLKQYDVMEDRYKLYDGVSEERGFNFEPLESMDMSRCSGIGHIYSNLQVSPPKYPRPLYGTSPSHSYSDVLRVVNLHSQSVDLSLSRPAASTLIPSSPTYQSYPLSPTLPTYLTPRSALSPTYHPYSGYY